MAKDMYQKRKEKQNKSEEIENKTNINWYPGHMAKTKREIAEVLSTIDVVIELVDARIPFSSHIPDLDDIVKNKNVIIVFNKIDLCDENETKKWIKFFENKNYCVVKSDSKYSNDYKNVIRKINELTIELNNKRKRKGLLPKKPKLLVLGVPNVGKSTLINKIVGKNVAEVGNKPGITKSLKTIRVNNNLNLVDTPGILWPKIDNIKTAYNLSTMSIIKEEIIPINEVSYYIIKSLYNYYPNILKKMNINISNIDDVEEVYCTISKSLNIPIKNNEVNYEIVGYAVLNLIKSEKLKGITFDRL